MDKRREALKKLLRARNKDYSVYITEENKACEEAYKKLHEKYGDLIEYNITPEDADFLPKGFWDWYEHGDGALYAAAIDNDFLEEELEELNNPTLEEIADIISNNNFGLTDFGIDIVFSGIDDMRSTELCNNDLICRLMERNDMSMRDVEVIEKLGEAYGRLGIPVDKLPQIGMQDTRFLKGYLDNFPVKDKTIIKEESPEYGQYIELYNAVERAQSEVDLRHEKEEQEGLQGRRQKIAEAEALVDYVQGKQPE